MDYVIIPLGFSDRIYTETKNAQHKIVVSGEPFTFGENDVPFDVLIRKFIKSRNKSTVGVKGEGNKELMDIRNSYTLNLEGISLNSDINLTDKLEQLNKIATNKFEHLDFKFDLINDNEDNDENVRLWQLHGYEEGCFFSKHVDGRKNIYHFGTLLLFPPNTSKFEGGDLLLYLPNEKITIAPSTFTEWTIVAFRLNVPHECTPITKGIRFVFKTELEVKTNFRGFIIDQKAELIPNDIINQTFNVYYESKILKLQNKIEKLQLNCNRFKKGELSDRITNIINKIKEDKNTDCIIVLKEYYDDSEDYKNLNGKDAMLWNEIVKIYPHCKLENIEGARSNRGDGNDAACDSLDFPFNDYDKMSIYYNVNLEKHSPGFIVDNESQYNDNTYDNINIVNVSCIFVQK